MSDYFDNYFFTSNQTSYVCPGFGSFECQPPNACARDPNTGKRYCCGYGDVCWTIPSTCQNDGSTFNCGNGQDVWCCLDKTEICTGTSGQINICWSSAHDTLVNISTPVLNKTFSSLSAAYPSASSWTFDPATLIAATQTSSETTSALGSSPSTTPNGSSETPTAPSSATTAPSSATTAPSPTSAHDSSVSISGGAIGGIVVGAIVVIALLALGIYLLKRRNRQDKTSTLGAPVYEADGKAEAHAHAKLGSMQFAQELYASHSALELQGHEDSLPPQELPANSIYSPHRVQETGP